MVKDALRGYLALASGVTEMTAARARAAARALAEQGESTAGQVTALAEDLMETSRRNREGLVLIVRHEVEATLRRLGLGAAGDVDALKQRVRRLEQALREVERGNPAPAETSSNTAKKTTRKKATAKKSVAKKSAAKKTTAKKSTTRKSTSRAVPTKRSGAKKSAAKRSARGSARRGRAS
jgi:polyhydroxyalkanoate synthesis regulator phasin